MTRQRTTYGRIRGNILTGLGILSAVIGLGMLITGYYVKDVMMIFGLGFLVCCLGLLQYRSRDY